MTRVFVDNGLGEKLERKTLGFQTAVKDSELIKKEEKIQTAHILLPLCFWLIGGVFATVAFFGEAEGLMDWRNFCTSKSGRSLIAPSKYKRTCIEAKAKKDAHPVQKGVDKKKTLLAKK